MRADHIHIERPLPLHIHSFPPVYKRNIIPAVKPTITRSTSTEPDATTTTHHTPTPNANRFYTSLNSYSATKSKKPTHTHPFKPPPQHTHRFKYQPQTNIVPTTLSNYESNKPHRSCTYPHTPSPSLPSSCHHQPSLSRTFSAEEDAMKTYTPFSNTYTQMRTTTSFQFLLILPTHHQTSTPTTTPTTYSTPTPLHYGANTSSTAKCMPSF